MVDDRLRFLAAMKKDWGDRVTTASSRQGKFANDPEVLAPLRFLPCRHKRTSPHLPNVPRCDIAEYEVPEMFPDRALRPGRSTRPTNGLHQAGCPGIRTKSAASRRSLALPRVSETADRARGVETWEQLVGRRQHDKFTRYSQPERAYFTSLQSIASYAVGAPLRTPAIEL
jgi:hypothetical protein